MYQRLSDTQKAAKLFEGWNDTPVWSCFQGIMGEIYVDSLETPVSAMAILGDFCFFAGKPDAGLVAYKPENRTGEFVIMVPGNESWGALIEKTFGGKTRAITRYALRKDKVSFDREALQAAAASLPAGYSLKLMDRELFSVCRSQSWSRDFVSQFKDYEEYQKMGLGVLILKDGEVVSGASSYSRYEKGIEIEVDTRADHRKQGLAYICCATLILECLERNLFPAWDAHNEASLALALKLGYHFDHEYRAYEIWGW